MNPNHTFLYGFYLFLLSLDNWLSLMRQKQTFFIANYRSRTFQYMDASWLWDD